MSSISYRVPSKDDYPKVIDAFVEFFLQKEPGINSLGAYPNGIPETLRARYTNFLNDNVSVVAVDTDKNCICGVMVSCIITRENNGNQKMPNFEELSQRLPEKHAKINIVCNDSIHSSDFFENHPDFQKCIDLFAIGVSESYQRRGIGTKLVSESMKRGKESGCDSAIIIATNPYTNGIAKKLDFKHYKSVKWEDYKDKESGEHWFPLDKLPYSHVNSYYTNL